MSVQYFDFTKVNAIAEAHPYSKGKPRRYLLSHCAGCRMSQHKPVFVAVYGAEEHKNVTVYTLCQTCAGRFTQRHKKARSRFVGKVERNLEKLGAHAEVQPGRAS